MGNYEYIIASLPDLSPEWKSGDATPQDYINEILGQCSEKDRKAISFMLDGLDGEKLDEDFYKTALAHGNRFIREYFRFDLNMRNAKVRHLNSALGRAADKDVINMSGEESGEEFPEAQAVDTVLSLNDILARERGLDDLMWKKIETLTTFNYFDLDAILGFIAKLGIVSRWYRLDEQTGREMFRKLVDEVRGTFKGVEYTGE